jgi:microcystin-dependent protein
MSLTKITNRSILPSTILSSNIADGTISGSKLALGTVTRDRLASDAADSNPIGTIIFFAGTTPPVGYLIADGSILDRTVYPELFSVIGTSHNQNFNVPSSHFRIPDLRGEFVRGWDNGKGTDPNRVFGSFQEEMINQHKHWISSGSYDDGNMSTTGVSNTQEAGLANDAGVYTVDDMDKVFGRFCRMDPGYGVNYETRPRNISLLPCIKFGNGQAFGQTAINIQALAATKLNLTGGTLTGDLILQNGAILRSITTLIDTANYSTTTAWALGPVFPTINNLRANSFLRLSMHTPCRNDSTSWGGAFLEPQVSFDNGVTWRSLGSSGYDAVMSIGNHIGSYFQQFLLYPQIASTYSFKVRLYFRSYDSTVRINEDHAINSVSGTVPLIAGATSPNQHYAKIIVEEYL